MSVLIGYIVVYINSNSSVQGIDEMEFGRYGFGIPVETRLDDLRKKKKQVNCHRL